MYYFNFFLNKNITLHQYLTWKKLDSNSLVLVMFENNPQLIFLCFLPSWSGHLANGGNTYLLLLARSSAKRTVVEKIVELYTKNTFEHWAVKWCSVLSFYWHVQWLRLALVMYHNKPCNTTGVSSLFLQTSLTELR